MSLEEQKQQQIDDLSIEANNNLESTTQLWKEVSEEEASKLVGARLTSHSRRPRNGREARGRGSERREYEEAGNIGFKRRRMQFDRRGNPSIILSPTTQIDLD